MVYRREHDCNVSECTELTAYVRIGGKYTRIGHYGSACSRFDQTKNELEISQLRDKVEEIDDLKKEVQKLREAQAKSDKKIIETMKRDNLFHDF